MIWLATAAAIVLIASLLSFVAIWRDKRAAGRGGWRTPESTLHLLELLGGWPGSLAGQRLFRHKTQKLSYRVVFWLCAASNVGALVAITWWRMSGR